MRCDWQECDNRDDQGVGDVHCPRCGRVIYSTPNTAKEIRGDYSCLTWPRAWEIGSWLAYALSLIGLRKEAWQKFKGLCGLGAQCGCDQREAKLNTLGHKLALLFGRILGIVRKYLSSIYRYVGRGR